LQVIAPERAPLFLSAPEQKKHLLSHCGAETVMLDFTPDLCNLTARQWFERLRDEYDVRVLVLGYDNTFGRDGRSLSPDDYVRIGREAGIEVVIAPAVPGCSSTAVRKAVSLGDMQTAADILGRPYTLTGTINHGDRIGSTIGIPTANLQPATGMVIPANGVYAAYIRIPDSEYRQCVVNVGHRPSLDDSFTHRLRIEAHIPAWQGNLYDATTELLFVSKIRDEQPFDTLDKLKAQIDLDISAMRAILARKPAVSVIIPVYNGSKYLHETIHSLMAQTRTDWEALLVDDSSTDDSLTIISDYARRDSRIRAYTKPNEGFATYGIKFALPHARGLYTQYMSQDDLLSADYFAVALEVAQSSEDIDAVLPLMRSWSRRDGTPLQGVQYPTPSAGICLTGHQAFILSLNWQINGFAMFRTEMMRQLGVSTTYLNDDEYDTRRLYLTSRRVCTAPCTFYYHTGNADAISRRWRPAMTGYIACDAKLLTLALDHGLYTPEVRIEIGRRLADDALRVYDIARKSGAGRHDISRIAREIRATRHIWNVRGVSR
ncbi:MAG: glycosyltransferase, partial [Muribaculaceae bacterium]|nr:glycosyltransferase [Muribaculaceae bacterium]